MNNMKWHWQQYKKQISKLFCQSHECVSLWKITYIIKKKTALKAECQSHECKSLENDINIYMYIIKKKLWKLCLEYKFLENDIISKTKSFESCVSKLWMQVSGRWFKKHTYPAKFTKVNNYWCWCMLIIQCS